MIESIVIIKEGGICIYNKNFTVSKVDEQLLSGFLIAVSNFSKEVMTDKSELQTINTKDQKIVAYEDKELKLTIAAIADILDQDNLLLKVLRMILIEFDNKYHNVLDDPKISSYNQKFDSIAKEIIFQRISERGKKQIILGLMTGGLLVLVLFMLQSGLFLEFATRYFSSFGMVSQIWQLLLPFAIFSLEMQLIGFISFAPAGYVSGYIAGSRKRGKYIGMVLSITLFIFSIIFLIIVEILSLPQFFLFISVGLLVLMITYIPSILTITFVFSYLGGLTKDKKKLYPIPPEREVYIDI